MGKSEDKSEKSFWATIPGIITAIAALITAVTGCIAAVIGIPVIAHWISPPTPATESEPPIVNTTQTAIAIQTSAVLTAEANIVSVPSVTQTDLISAKNTIESSGLCLELLHFSNPLSSGKPVLEVSEQYPTAGNTVKRNTVIFLSVVATDSAELLNTLETTYQTRRLSFDHQYWTALTAFHSPPLNPQCIVSWPDHHEHAHPHPHEAGEHHHHPHQHPHRPGSNHHHPY
jgi:hypothetical protein